MGPERSILSMLEFVAERYPEMTLCVIFRNMLDFIVWKEPTWEN
jgi:hypothetical protein